MVVNFTPVGLHVKVLGSGLQGGDFVFVACWGC